ncbi:protein NRT1/ PTR FAMILY 5.2-like [Populus alba]|uniref:protein NRT1/ PTR FAMILY 5.2-like n=1 Tax=Populus alba TaxID=43335 RepID=UPI003CC6F9A7
MVIDDSGSRIVLVVLRDEATETREMSLLTLAVSVPTLRPTSCGHALAAGSGGTKPSISTMGADQFDVYIQDNVGWTLGYALPTLGLAVSIIVFLVGTPFYRHKLPAESPLTRMAQVLVAAVKKWKVPVPDDPKQLHELSLDEYIGSGKELTIPLLLGNAEE